LSKEEIYSIVRVFHLFQLNAKINNFYGACLNIISGNRKEEEDEEDDYDLCLVLSFPSR
jgi:hypothetical protein